MVMGEERDQGNQGHDGKFQRNLLQVRACELQLHDFPPVPVDIPGRNGANRGRGQQDPVLEGLLREAGGLPEEVLRQGKHDAADRLDAIGLRQLEAHSGQAPPAWVRFHTIRCKCQYGLQVGTHTIAQGRIEAVGAEGITFDGGHGDLVISTEVKPGPNLLYVFPRVTSP